MVSVSRGLKEEIQSGDERNRGDFFPQKPLFFKADGENQVVFKVTVK